MTDKNYTHFELLVDESGSMATTASDTVGGINTFITGNKDGPGRATLSLTKFDSQTPFNPVYAMQDIATVELIRPSQFTPGGSTPLLDAIGNMINALGRRLALMPEDQRPGKVVINIITDGLENASKMFSREQIRGMIDLQRGKYNWEFVFIGANQDAITAGESLGIGRDTSLTYTDNPAGIRAVYTSLVTNSSRLRGGTGQTMGFSDDQRVASMAVDVSDTTGVDVNN